MHDTTAPGQAHFHGDTGLLFYRYIFCPDKIFALGSLKPWPLKSSHSVRLITHCSVKTDMSGRTSGVSRVRPDFFPFLVSQYDNAHASGCRRHRNAISKVAFSFGYKDKLWMRKAYTHVVNLFLPIKRKHFCYEASVAF